ncbi:MAG: hypothetical protein PHI96_07945, partial [Desulfovibrio sp.]|nr:hypothetical protein [Desulfovibrio sp.]
RTVLLGCRNVLAGNFDHEYRGEVDLATNRTDKQESAEQKFEKNLCPHSQGNSCMRAEPLAINQG